MKVLNLLKIDFDKKRVYGLDILRAFAILFVVIEHGTQYLPTKYNLQFFSRLLVFDGVSFFFVLSGFLIGGILIKILEQKPPTFKTLFHFWERRWFRTLPNYYLVLILLIFILPFIFYGSVNNPLGKVSYFFFSQSLFYPHPEFFGEAWSLCIEEWFYLIIPSLIFLLVGMFYIKPKNSLLIIAISVIIIVTGFRFYRYIHFPTYSSSHHAWDENFRKQVVTRLDSLMYGLIGAFFSFYYKSIWIKNKKNLFVLGIVMLLFEKYGTYLGFSNSIGLYTCVFSFSFTSFATLLLLPFLSEYKNGKGFIYTMITYISLISYSMYLINLQVIHEFGVDLIAGLVHRILHLPFRLLNYPCYWAITIVGSILLFKYFEKPVMNLRERIK